MSVNKNGYYGQLTDRHKKTKNHKITKSQNMTFTKKRQELTQVEKTTKYKEEYKQRKEAKMREAIRNRGSEKETKLIFRKSNTYFEKTDAIFAKDHKPIYIIVID